MVSLVKLRMQGIAVIVQNGASVSLEPGGQFELSGATLKDVHACQRELDTHLEQVGCSFIRKIRREFTEHCFGTRSVQEYTDPCYESMS